MSPATTRSAAAKSRKGRALKDGTKEVADSDSSSSSEEEDIPARVRSLPQRGLKGVSTVPTLRPRNAPKRPHDFISNSPEPSLKGTKRQKTNENLTSRSVSRHSQMESSPFSTLRPETFRRDSPASSMDDEITPEFMNLINDMLKRPPRGDRGLAEASKLPAQQLHGQGASEKRDEEILDQEVKSESEDELLDEYLSAEPLRHSHQPAQQDPNNVASARKDAAQSDTGCDSGQKDLSTSGTDSSSPRDGRRVNTAETQRDICEISSTSSFSPSPSVSLSLDAGEAAGTITSGLQESTRGSERPDTRHDGLGIHDTDMEYSEQFATPHPTHNPADGVQQCAYLESDSDVDFEVPSDIDDMDITDPSTKLFKQEVHRFTIRKSEYEEDSVFFDAPDIGQDVAIHLSCDKFYRIANLMGKTGWTGISKDWEDKFLQHHKLNTTAGRTMCYYILKLERLCAMTPKAPSIAEQNMFLGEHGDYMKYCLSMIESGIEFIRTKRLSFPRQADIFKGNRLRRIYMARDLTRVIIPLCTRCLVEIWYLGGDDELHTRFTSFAIQLLTRAVGWISKLYGPLRRELGNHTLDPNPRTETHVIQAQQDRDNLGPLLENLRGTLGRAPDILRLVENRRAFHRRQRERDLQIEAEREAEAQARERKNIEQNANVARSIRLRAAMSASQRPTGTPRSRAISSPMSTSQPSSGNWTDEEEIRLIMKLRDSYPGLPNLVDTALVLGHSQKETLIRSGPLLRTMLLAVRPNRSEEDVDKEVHEVLRPWKESIQNRG